MQYLNGVWSVGTSLTVMLLPLTIGLSYIRGYASVQAESQRLVFTNIFCTTDFGLDLRYGVTFCV